MIDTSGGEQNPESSITVGVPVGAHFVLYMWCCPRCLTYSSTSIDLGGPGAKITCRRCKREFEPRPYRKPEDRS